MNDLFGGDPRYAELEARVAALEAMLNLKAQPERVKADELNEAWQVWNRHRNGKGWTAKARELSMRELRKLAGTDGALALKIVEQSILRGWTGLFPLRSSDTPTFGSRGIETTRPRDKTVTEALARTETRDENHAAWLANQRQRGYDV